MKKIKFKIIAAAATVAGILPSAANTPCTESQERPAIPAQTAVVATGASSPVFSTPLPTSKILDYGGGTTRPRVDDGLSVRLLEQRDKNLVIRKKYTKPAQSAPTGVGSSSYNATVTYYDALGYVDQKIEPHGSPIYNDVITPYKHDFLGHEDAWEYVPYTASSSANGLYRVNAASAAEKWHQDATYEDTPYLHRKYERSAAGRVLSRNLPGSGASVAQKYLYSTATSASDKVLSIKPGSAAGTFTVASSYKADGSLFKTTVTDEDGRTCIVFTDGTGKKVLDRKLDRTPDGAAVFVDTYYVYDTLDRLVCVIQPEGSKRLTRGTTYNTSSSGIFSGHAYHYRYDAKGRLAEKKLPDTGWEYFVYDRNNRLVMRQDGNMRQPSVHRWLLYRYDSFGRLTSDNMVSDSKSSSGSFYSRNDWQQRYDNGQTALPSGVVSQTAVAKTYGSALRSVREPYLTVSIRKDTLLAINVTSDEVVWQELVTLDPQRIFFDEKGVIREEYRLGDVGQALGERPRRYYYVPVEFGQQILEICGHIAPATWGMVTNLSFISQLKLPACISGKLDLYSPAGYIYSSTELAFRPVSGVVTLDDVDTRNKGLKTSERLAYIDKTGLTDKFLTRNFYYDSKGRAVQIVEDLGGEGFIRYSTKYDYTGNVVAYREEHYNNLGNLLCTKRIDCVYDHRGRLMTETTSMGNAVGVVKFSYDELGRLVSKRISGTGNDKLTQYYRYNIRGHLIETGSPNLLTESLGSTVKGEIRRIFTQVSDQPRMQTDIDYDALGRLVYARTQHPVGPAETFASYDANGNIMRLRQQMQLPSRPDPTGRTQTYTYAGNSVMEMEKEVDLPPHQSPRLCHFDYDSNGNMTYNGNKSLQLKYNYLNLLSEAIHADGSGVEYMWLADGTKMAVTPKAAASGDIFTYRGSLECNITKNYVATNFSGGILLRSAADSSVGISVVHIQDHLGSVRLALLANEGLYNEYEPFGERDNTRSENAGWNAVSDGIPNRHLFNGKEIQLTASIGLLDYGARMYDPEMARWMAPDPKVEKYYDVSPYAFCNNAPVNNVELDGREWVDVNGNVMYKDGKWTQCATEDAVRVGRAMMATATGREAFEMVANSAAKFQLQISPEVMKDEQGRLIRGMTNIERINTTQNDKGFYEPVEGTVTIYEGSLKEELSNSIPAGEIAWGIKRLPEKYRLEGALGSVGVHESYHTTPENVTMRIMNKVLESEEGYIPYNEEETPEHYQLKHLQQLHFQHNELK